MTQKGEDMPDKKKKLPIIWTTASNLKVIKRCFIVVFLVMAAVFTALTACGGSLSEDDAVATGEHFPAFTMTDLSDTSVTVDESIFAEYPLTVINFWYTGCGWCIQEMPDIESAAAKFAGRAHVIGICIDVSYQGEVQQEYLESARKILRQRGATYENYYPDTELEDYIFSNVYGYPTTYFIGGDGEILRVVTGSLSEDGWYNEISTMLKKVE